MFSITFFDLIVLLGMIQGMVMLTILLFSKPSEISKNLLCGILITLVLLSSKILLHTLGLWNVNTFRYFPLAIDTAIQPLFYLYACAATSRNFVWKTIYSGHFIPVFVFMIYALGLYFVVLPEHNFALKDQMVERASFQLVKGLEDWLALLSAMVYWGLSFLRIRKYRIWLFQNESNTSYQEFTWLRNLLVLSGIFVLALAAISLLENVLPFGRSHFIHLELFYLFMAFLTYFLGLKGYQLYSTSRQFDLLPVSFAGTDFSVFPETENEEETLKDNLSLTENNIDFETIKTCIIQVLSEEKLFLNPELSLKDLARKINYPASSVSAVINQSFRMNFRSLVNEYRVEEVKNRLSSMEATHLSLLGIALDCGFNSEASFYRVFRKNTGLSPNDFIKSLN